MKQGDKNTGSEQAKAKADKPVKLLKSGVPVTVGKATQFQPGQSGNPAGKPKGARHITTIIQDLANDEDFKGYIKDGTGALVYYEGAPIRAIVGAMIQEASFAEDPRVKHAAREQLLKYGWNPRDAGDPDDNERRTITPKIISQIKPRDDHARIEAQTS